MNLKHIIDIYNVIRDRLPKTYPRLRLAFFEDEDCMLDNNEMIKKEDESIYAILNPDTLTINLPLKMALKYIDTDGQIISNKVVPITKFSIDDIAKTILHEFAHLYFGNKHGYDSKQYTDERACDKFANRWFAKLKQEKLV